MSGFSLSDLDLAHRLADAARDAILPYFRHPELSADSKGVVDALLS